MASNAPSVSPLRQRARPLAERIGGAEALLLLAWPWLLAAVSPAWLYMNATGFVDAWIYLGQFTNLQQNFALYRDPNFYYISRLSWIVPGYVAYQLLPPLAANLALRLFLFYLTAFGIYGALAGVSRRAALLTALLLGGYSYFLLAAGWDYVDGPGAAYLSAALGLIALAHRRPRRRRYLVLAGAAAAAMVAANLFTVVLTPCLALFLVLLHRGQPLGELARAVLWGLLGALGLLGGLGAASVALGGEFLFLLPSLRFASYVAGMSSNPWVATSPDWPIRHGFLVLPAAVALAAGLAVAIPALRAQLRAHGHALACLLTFLLGAAILVALQLRGSNPVLEVPFYASYSIPLAFLALGALLAPSLEALGARGFAATVAATLALALAGLLVNTCRQSGPAAVLPAMAVVGLAVALLLARITRLWHLAPLLLGLLFVTPGAFSDPSGFATCAVARPETDEPDLYLGVMDGHAAVQELAPGRRVYFWYNQGEQPAFRNLASMYVYTWNLVGEEFPAVQTPAALTSGTTVALLSTRPDALDTAARALSLHGAKPRLVGQREVGRGALRYTVTVFEVEQAPVSATFGQELDLSAAGAVRQALRDGWAAPEAFGAWTLGPRAELVADLDPPAGWDVALSLDVVAYVGGFVPEERRPTVTVQVLANDVPVGSWAFDPANTAGRRQVVIPAAVLARERPLRLTLAIDRPHSLQELGYNDDARPLGIAVSALRFELAQ